MAHRVGPKMGAGELPFPLQLPSILIENLLPPDARLLPIAKEMSELFARRSLCVNVWALSSFQGQDVDLAHLSPLALITGGQVRPAHNPIHDRQHPFGGPRCSAAHLTRTSLRPHAHVMMTHCSLLHRSTDVCWGRVQRTSALA